MELSPKLKLLQCIAEAISTHTEIPLTEVRKLLESPKNKQFGELAFPCFLLSKKWGQSPPQCAQRLASELPLPNGVAEATAQGPFLNFRFSRADYLAAVLGAPLAAAQPNGQTAIVEYSSPNIAKPFHVGHLRATLIGNCLDRVYRSAGWNTISINHLGDWGTQFGYVWAGCSLWGEPSEFSVSSLVDIYRRATALKEDQEQKKPDSMSEPNVTEMARAYFQDLEAGEGYAVDFWKECVQVSIAYLETTYARLGVKFDHYTGESFYSDKLAAVEAELREAGVLSESQGALGVDLGTELGFARILTSDGRSLYLTRDLATAKYRAETYHFNRAVYVVGAPQTLHFQQLKEILRRLERPYAETMLHVAFGHVMGMKTRGEGSFIELNDFLDEAYQRALDAYRTEVTKKPEGLDESTVARGVALAAILYSTLSRTNIKDVHFSWDHALTFQGDSGPYLLYAYARISGIEERCASVSLDAPVRAELLTEESAFQLGLLISEFSEVVQKVVDSHEPSLLTAYAIELAKAFSKAYQELKVLGEPDAIATARLQLFRRCKATLGEALRLLGIEPLERM